MTDTKQTLSVGETSYESLGSRTHENGSDLQTQVLLSKAIHGLTTNRQRPSQIMSIKENNKPLNDYDRQNPDRKPFLAINTVRDVYMPKKQSHQGSQRLKMPKIKHLYSPRDYDIQVGVMTTSNIDNNFKLFSNNNPLLSSNPSLDCSE